MNKIFFLIAILFSLSVKAQDISGKLLEENEQKAPISFATMALYKSQDSTLVQAVVTDADGNFAFDKISKGNYYIQVSMIGYERKKISPVTFNGDKLSLGNVGVKEDNLQLQEIVVEGRQEVIEQTESGTIVNANANLTQTGGTAVDILRNVPGVTVDADGNITLRGTGANILIDGRNSSLGNNLQQIPASAIESIEILNSPSARYDAAGEGGVINIKLKKNKKQGLNGSVGATVGSQDLYAATLRLNYKAKNVNFFGGYDMRSDKRFGYNIGDRVTFGSIINQRLDQYRAFDNQDQSHNVTAGMDIDLSKKTRITLEGLYNYNRDGGVDALSSIFTDSNTQSITSINNRRGNDFGENQLMEYSLSFKHALRQKGQEISGFYTYSNNNRVENTDIFSETSQANGTITNTVQQKLYNRDPFQLHVFQIDLTQPIKGEVLTLETGYKINYRGLNTESGILNWENNTQSWVAQNVNNFKYEEQIHALYFLLKGKKNKWSYNAGLRAEQTFVTGISDFDNVRFNKEYLNFFPNVRLNYQFDKANSLRVSYAARINRPNTGFLNPFRDVSDSLNIRTGNPNLDPEIVHAIELSYSLIKEKFTFSPTLFYRYRDNAIQRTVTVDNRGISTVFPLNVGFAYTYGLDLVTTYQFAKWWDINFNFSLFQNEVQGLNNGAVTDLVRSSTSWTTRAINNFTLWKDLKMQITANYGSPIATAQGELLERFSVEAGLQKNLMDKKAKLGFVATDILNTLQFGFSAFGDGFTQSRVFKRNTQRFIISFSYQFGKPFQERRKRAIGEENRMDD